MDEGFLTDFEYSKYLKLLLVGDTGSGKSFSALEIADLLGIKPEEIGIINSEALRGLAYIKEFGVQLHQVFNIRAPFVPEKYQSGISQCIARHFKLIIIDSLSHEWSGKGGASNIVKNSGTKDGRMAWHEYKTGRHADLVADIMNANCHIIATARLSTEYDTVEDEKTGKTKYVRVGQQVQQEKNLDYEFDFVFKFNKNHTFKVEKHSTGKMNIFDCDYDYEVDEFTVQRLKEWLSETNSSEVATTTITESTEPLPEAVEDTASASVPVPAKVSKPVDVEKEANRIMDLIEVANNLPEIETIQKEIDLWRHKLPPATVKWLEDALMQNQFMTEIPF